MIKSFTPTFALDDETMAIVLSHVHKGARTVLELGSGRSTVEIARALQKGARLVALEESAEYHAQTAAHLKAEGLSVDLVHSPLVPEIDDGEWYDLTKIQPTLAPGSVDLLVIDGPVDNGKDVRSGALRLEKYLSPYAVIVVDDAKRDGEKRLLGSWMRTFPGWSWKRYNTDRGCVVLWREEP